MTDPSPRSSDLLDSSSSPKRSRLGRALRIGLGLLVLLLLVAAGVAWWALGTDAGRQRVLEEVDGVLEESTGWSIDAEDFDLSLRDGTLTLRDVVLEAAEPADLDAPDGATDGEATDPDRPRQWLRADEVQAEFELGALRQTPRKLKRVRVEGGVLDLRAPMPDRDSPDDESSSGLPVSIDQVELVDSRIEGKPLEKGWLERWSVEGVDASGSLVDDAIDLDVENGTVVLERRDAEQPLELALSGAVRGPAKGPFTVDRLRLDAVGPNGEDALDLDASGTVGFGSDDPIRAKFTLDARPALLLPEVASGAGRLQASGDLDLRRMTGTLEVEARAFPPAVLEPFVGPETLDTLQARGTAIDIDASLDLREPGADGVYGQADATWRRGDEVLLEADLRTLDAGASSDGAEPLVVRVDATLLPATDGVRTLEGLVRAPSWTRFGEARFDDARVTIETDDVAAQIAALRERWPNLVPADEELPLEGRPLRGALDLVATLDGPLASPAVSDGEAVWRPAPLENPETIVRLEASGRPLDGVGDAAVELESFDLATLGLGVEGVLEGTASVEGSRSDFELSADLVGTELGAAADPNDLGATDDSQPRLRRVELVADTDGRTIEIERLEGDLWLPDAPAALDREVPRAEDGAAPGSRVPVDPDSIAVEGEIVAITDDEADEDLAADLGIVDESTPDPEALAATVEAARTGEPTSSEEIDLAEVDVAEAGGTDGAVDDSIERGRLVPFRADGSFQVRPGSDPLVRGGELRLATERPAPGIETIEIAAFLENGAVRLDLLELQGRDGAPEIASLDAVLPLGALAEVPGLGDAVRALPVARSDGDLTLAVTMPRLDTDELAAWLGWPARAERLRTGLEVALRLDPADPTAGSGSIVLLEPVLDLRDASVVTATDPRIVLDERRLRLPQTQLLMNDSPFEIEAEAALSPGWRLDEPVSALLRDYRAFGTGGFALALLDPYLAGGVGTGTAEVTVDIQGTLDSLDGSLTATSEEGSFQFVQPYATRLTQPSVTLRLQDGEILVENVEGKLNEGDLDVEGVIDLDGTTRLEGFFDRVRYRVDYGLTVIASGNFELVLPEEADPLLRANVLVERGYLRSNIDPDREILSRLLAPPDLGDDVEDPDSFAASLRLDIDVATVDGISVKNNLADLRASWAPLSVEGTLAAPRVEGAIDVDPDGRVYAYGQVVRIDEARLEFSGDPRVENSLEIETTTSLEDPTIATSDDRRVLASLDRNNWRENQALTEEERAKRTQEAVAYGVSGYYGTRLASRLTSGLGVSTRLVYEPLFLFGETDPEARLIISRELNRHATLALALNLTRSEGSFYFLDLHDFEPIPSLSAVAFTNEESDYGTVLQQEFEFGGGRVDEDDDRPILKDVEVDCTGCRSKRLIERALPYDEDERIPISGDFDVEVDVAEAMRRAGYADPTVRADFEPNPRRAEEVKLLVEIDAGPYAEFAWSGEKPPRRRREAITDLYRADFYEDASIEEMRELTVRVWRANGHPDPEVEVRVELLEPDEIGPRRRVVIHSEPGPTLDLDELIVRVAESAGAEALPQRVSEAIDLRFDSVLSRMELAVGLAEGDRRLLQTLRAWGYPEAEIVERRLEPDEERLTVEVEPGPRRIVESVRLVGVSPEALTFDTSVDGDGDAADEAAIEPDEASTTVALPSPDTAEPDTESLSPELRERLLELVTIEPGAPALDGEIGAVAIEMERRLGTLGYRDAEVRPHREVLEGDRVALEYRVAPGRRSRLAELKIEGERDTSRNWIRRTTGLQEGEVLSSRDVSLARRRLVQTGIFDRVLISTDPVDGSEASGTAVTLDLIEGSRYLFGYGLRWEDSEGFGVAVDAVDQNAFGRAVSIGARALVAEEEWAFRLYGEIPRIFDTPIDASLFAEVFDEEEFERAEDGFEVSGQLEFPVGSKVRGRVYARYRDAFSTDFGFIPPDERTIRSPVLGVQFLIDERDDPLDPHRGWFASIDLSGSRDLIGAQEDYDRVYGQFDFFLTPQSLFDGRVTWAQGIRAGIADVAENSELPLDVRFFAGGQYSVRGYNSRSLGDLELTDNETLRPEGGEASLILNQELRVRVFGGYWAVLFYDIGNVWTDADDFGDTLRAGIGLGIRAHTPIGLLRLDLAKPLDRRDVRQVNGELYDDEYEISFGFGQAF